MEAVGDEGGRQGTGKKKPNDKARYEDSWECTIRAGSRSFLFGTLLHSTVLLYLYSGRSVSALCSVTYLHAIFT